MSSAKWSKFFEIRIKQAVAEVEAKGDVEESVKISTILYFANWSTIKRKWNSAYDLIEQSVGDGIKKTEWLHKTEHAPQRPDKYDFSFTSMPQ